MSEPILRAARGQQELRRRAGAARRRLHGARRRGHRARRRQRRRQVHAGQVRGRDPPDRQRRDPASTASRSRSTARPTPPHLGHRGRLPGPRAGRQPRHRAEHVPRPGARQAVAARRGRHGAGRPRARWRRCRCAPSRRCGCRWRRCPAGSARPSPSPRPCCGTPRSCCSTSRPPRSGVAQTRQVLDLVRRLAEQGLGVVLISHNMADVFEVADRIASPLPGPDGRRSCRPRRSPTARSSS